MAKNLLINKTLGEIRIALVENGEVVDYLLSREVVKDHQRPVLGNVYKGKVVRVLPGMQSAFVDIGHEKAAFLYVDDAYIPTIEEQRELLEKTQKLNGDKKESQGQVIPDELSTLKDSMDLRVRKDIQIEDIIKEGDSFIVQVSKEPISTKGPRVTRHITLAGCYLVYAPFIEHIGVSRRIRDEAERNRLRGILEDIQVKETGLIARTIAEGQSAKTLQTDYKVLSQVWEEIKNKGEKAKPKKMIHQDLSFVERAIRDIADDDVHCIYVDDEATLKTVKKFINKHRIHMNNKLEHYRGPTPLFEKFGIEIEIERALSNKVYLKSGGSINIDQTEALVSIDVNTGKFVGKRTFDETVLKTNLEAVKEIADQLRIRNCGGIVIIDFIDMEKAEHREQVFQSLLGALKKDRAKTNVQPISELGLVEMTRKRTRDTLSRIMCGPCPYCEGSGRIKSVSTVCYEIMRKVIKTASQDSVKKISLYAHPEVSALLSSSDADIISLVEKQYGKTITIRAENNYHFEQYELNG